MFCNLRFALSLFVLASLVACASSDFHEERLAALLGTNNFSEVRGVTDGFHDTFHHYRFVTEPKVIDAFVGRFGLEVQANSYFSEDVYIHPLFGNRRKVKWWQPRELANHPIYFKEVRGVPFMTRYDRESLDLPALTDDEEGQLHYYKLGFNPDTGVTYLIEAYP